MLKDIRNLFFNVGVGGAGFILQQIAETINSLLALVIAVLTIIYLGYKIAKIKEDFINGRKERKNRVSGKQSGTKE